MVDDSIIKFLDLIDDDFLFINFLSYEEKFISALDNLNDVCNTIGALEVDDDFFFECQSKILDSCIPNLSDDDYNNFIDDICDILNLLDNNVQVLEYISDRICRMNIININWFLFNVSNFSRLDDYEAWFNNSKIVDAVKSKMIEMNHIDLLVMFTNCASVFNNNYMYNDTISFMIENMRDREFYFVSSFVFNTVLDNDCINDVLECRSSLIDDSILYFTNSFLSSENIDEVKEKVGDYDFTNFLSLISSNMLGCKHKVSYINENMAFLLYMLVNPSIYLTDVTAYGDIRYPYDTFSVDFIDDILLRLEGLTFQEIKILFANISNYEKPVLKEEINKYFSDRFGSDICFDNNDLIVAKRLRELADSISYSSFIYVSDLDGSCNFAINDTFEDLECKYSLLQNSYNNFIDTYSLIKYFNGLSLIQILLLICNSDFYDKVSSDFLLLDYIKYRICSENNSLILNKLLLLDLSVFSSEIIDFIEVKLYLMGLDIHFDNKKNIK